MRDIRLRARDPTTALAELVPRLTEVVRPHGFGAEAAGRDWAHWVRDDDSSVTLRAYASLTDGGVVSIIMTGAPMPAELKLDLRRAVVPP